MQHDSAIDIPALNASAIPHGHFEATFVKQPFDFQPRTRVIFGAGTFSRLGDIAAELQGQKLLLVSDPGIIEAGHTQRGIDSLTAAGLQVTTFENFTSNPTTDDIDHGLEIARSANIDLIVGLGGGSSMDCAKGVNFLLTNGGKMHDYKGIGKATQPMLPMIAVPTTSGTGSEAQSFALISDAKTHMKMACGDKKAACRVAILDPELTLSMPLSVTAATGIDAISHAVETYVTKPRNAVSQLYSLRAWQYLAYGFPRVMEDRRDMTARGAMLLGANFAGTAIENSMLGAAHALANPLTAQFNVTHGVAVGMMLPQVIRFNAEVVNNLYADLACEAGICERNQPDAPNQLAEYIEHLLRLAQYPASLSECGVAENALPALAEEAALQWTGKFNPRSASVQQFEEMYRCVLFNQNTAT